MPGELYSTKSLDAFLQGTNVAYSFVHVLNKDKITNVANFLKYLRADDKKAVLQMLQEEEEHFDKMMYETEKYLEKLLGQPRQENDTRFSFQQIVRAYIEGLKRSASAAKQDPAKIVNHSLIIDSIHHAIQTNDLDILKKVFALPHALSHLNRDTFDSISKEAGCISPEVAEVLIQANEAFLQKQPQEKFTSRYEQLFYAAGNANNGALVLFLYLTAKRLKVPFDLELTFEDILQKQKPDILSMLLDLPEFAEMIQQKNFLVNSCLKIADEKLILKLNASGLFDLHLLKNDANILLKQLEAAIINNNAFAATTILSEQRSLILAELPPKEILNVLKIAAQNNAVDLMQFLIQNPLFNNLINKIYATDDEDSLTLLEDIILSQAKATNSNASKIMQVLLSHPVLGYLGFNLISDYKDIKMKNIQDVVNSNAIDFYKLDHLEDNMLYFYLQEPKLFNSFTLQAGDQQLTSSLHVAQCMSICLSLSKQSAFKSRTINNANLAAKLTMFLTFVTHAQDDKLPEFARIFEDEILPSLVENQGNYINLIPYTAENFSNMLQYVSKENLARMLSLTENVVYNDWVFEILLRHLDLAQDKENILTTKVVEMLYGNLTDANKDTLIEALIEGPPKYVDLEALLLSIEHTEALNISSSELIIKIVRILKEETNMFALATLEVNADNLADHVLALEALDSYRYIALLDFVVKMTTHIQATQLVVSAEGEDLNAKMEIGWNILSKNLQDLKKSLASETDEHEMSVIDDLIEISSDLVKFEVYLSKIAELLKLQTVIPIPDILSALQVTREHMQKKLRFS